MKFIEIDNRIINVDHLIEMCFIQTDNEVNYPFEIKFESQDGDWNTYYRTVKKQQEDYTRIFKFLDNTSDKTNILTLKRYNAVEVKEKE